MTATLEAKLEMLLRKQPENPVRIAERPVESPKQHTLKVEGRRVEAVHIGAVCAGRLQHGKQARDDIEAFGKAVLDYVDSGDYRTWMTGIVRHYAGTDASKFLHCVQDAGQPRKGCNGSGLSRKEMKRFRKKLRRETLTSELASFVTDFLDAKGYDGRSICLQKYARSDVDYEKSSASKGTLSLETLTEFAKLVCIYSKARKVYKTWSYAAALIYHAPQAATWQDLKVKAGMEVIAGKGCRGKAFRKYAKRIPQFFEHVKRLYSTMSDSDAEFARSFVAAVSDYKKSPDKVMRNYFEVENGAGSS